MAFEMFWDFRSTPLVLDDMFADLNWAELALGARLFRPFMLVGALFVYAFRLLLGVWYCFLGVCWWCGFICIKMMSGTLWPSRMAVLAFELVAVQTLKKLWVILRLCFWVLFASFFYSCFWRYSVTCVCWFTVHLFLVGLRPLLLSGRWVDSLNLVNSLHYAGFSRSLRISARR